MCACVCGMSVSVHLCMCVHVCMCVYCMCEQQLAFYMVYLLNINTNKIHNFVYPGVL